MKKIDDMLIRFDRTHERDRQTDRQTPHDGIYGRTYVQHRAAKIGQLPKLCSNEGSSFLSHSVYVANF